MKVSMREQEILEMIADELTSKEIAKRLSISDHTVHSHRTNIMDKLGVKNAAGLVRRAFEVQLLTVNIDQR